VAYDDKDVEQAWYSEDEIQSFKEERKQIKKLVKKFSSLEVYERTMGNLHSCRGLEKYVSHTKAAQRKEHILMAIQLVQSAQADQRRNPVPSTNADEIISQAYQKVTKNCEKEAIARALLYMAWNNDNGADDCRKATAELIKTPESAIQLDRRIHSKTSSRLSPALSSITSFESRMAPSPPTSEEGNVSLLVSFLSFSKVLGKTRS
jgi:hypothetical protein